MSFFQVIKKYIKECEERFDNDPWKYYGIKGNGVVYLRDPEGYYNSKLFKNILNQFKDAEKDLTMNHYDEPVTLYTATCRVTREGWQWGVETSSHSFDRAMKIYMDDEDERVYIDEYLCWQKVCELNGEGTYNASKY